MKFSGLSHASGGKSDNIVRAVPAAIDEKERIINHPAHRGEEVTMRFLYEEFSIGRLAADKALCARSPLGALFLG